jgi:hypothetical protein
MGTHVQHLMGTHVQCIRLHEKCNRLQPIMITNYDYPMS